MRQKATVHISGCADLDPRTGGYGVVIQTYDGRKEFRGGEPRASEDRMVLTGLLVVLESLPVGSDVEVYTENRFVINTLKRGFDTSKKIKQKTLWISIAKAIAKHGHKVTVQWPIDRRMVGLADYNALVGMSTRWCVERRKSNGFYDVRTERV